MASRLSDVIIDCHDLDGQIEFWSAALGYDPAHRGDGWVALKPPGPEVPDEEWVAAPQVPFVSLVKVPEGKTVKNRVHIDLVPIDRSQADEVARLELLGAHRVDIGQRDTRWVVMADPEGNEFCVMDAVETQA